ncbi:MAG: metallophosphoesterase [Kiritimatiellae bacterium]|nr:metallophosphoesterase [Kiritimatiellia bacterium]
MTARPAAAIRSAAFFLLAASAAGAAPPAPDDAASREAHAAFNARTAKPEPFWFVQVTDTHDGMALHQWRFRQALAEIAELPVPVECLAHTGDFSCDSIRRKDVATEISNILSLATCPVVLAPGNHDLTFRWSNPTNRYLEAASAYRRYLGPLGQVHETSNAVYVALSTENLRQPGVPDIPGWDPVAFLDEALARAPDKPAFVFTHVPDCDDYYDGAFHPGWTDPEGLAAFRAVLRRHPNARAVMCGHFHRVVHEERPDGVPTISAGPIATFWGRQGSYRLYKYQDGCLSYQDFYIHDPPEGTHISHKGFVIPVKPRR